MGSQGFTRLKSWGTDGNVPHKQPLLGPVFCPDSAIGVMRKVHPASFTGYHDCSAAILAVPAQASFDSRDTPNSIPVSENERASPNGRSRCGIADLPRR